MVRQIIMGAGTCGRSYSPLGGQKAEGEGLRLRYSPKNTLPSDLLPSARLHLLKFQRSPKIALLAGG
jgi:hypothetical protein